jgi:hypothetical protein
MSDTNLLVNGSLGALNIIKACNLIHLCAFTPLLLMQDISKMGSATNGMKKSLSLAFTERMHITETLKAVFSAHDWLETTSQLEWHIRRVVNGRGGLYSHVSRTAGNVPRKQLLRDSLRRSCSQEAGLDVGNQLHEHSAC